MKKLMVGIAILLSSAPLLLRQYTNTPAAAEPTTPAAAGIRDVASYAGVSFGQKLAACVADLPKTGGICDARAISGEQFMTADITINTPGASILLGNIHLKTARSLIVPMGTHNVAIIGPTAFGAASNPVAHGAMISYTGTGAAVRVGNSTGDTIGFQWQDVSIDVTGASLTATGMQLIRVINFALIRPHVLGYCCDGKSNQTLLLLDGPVNYTGGSITQPVLAGGKRAMVFTNSANVNSNDGANAVFVYGGHLNGNNKCAGCIAVDIQNATGNSFFGGDYEGFDNAFKIGAHARYNYFAGIRHEANNSTLNFVRGSDFNKWDSAIPPLVSGSPGAQDSYIGTSRGR